MGGRCVCLWVGVGGWGDGVDSHKSLKVTVA